MRRYLKWFAAGLAFAVGGALAANLPFLTPQTAGNDFLPAINQLINQLNGGPGYSGTPQVVSLGQACSANGASPQTCNGQRGSVTFTNVTVPGNSQTGVTINNSFINPASICVASSGQNPPGAAGIGVVFTGSAGVMTLSFINASATTTGAVNMTVQFICM